MHPHISNISIFDATKIVVKEFDTTKDSGGGSHGVKIVVHSDEGQTTEITVWRGSGDKAEAPELVVRALHKAGPIESDGETDP
jgi:hypothetical protein